MQSPDNLLVNPVNQKNAKINQPNDKAHELLLGEKYVIGLKHYYSSTKESISTKICPFWFCFFVSTKIIVGIGEQSLIVHREKLVYNREALQNLQLPSSRKQLVTRRPYKTCCFFPAGKSMWLKSVDNLNGDEVWHHRSGGHEGVEVVSFHSKWATDWSCRTSHHPYTVFHCWSESACTCMCVCFQ